MDFQESYENNGRFGNVLEIHLLMFGTLLTSYTWKITLYKPQGCFHVYELRHSLHPMESHNVILFNYVANYAKKLKKHFFLNFVM